MSASVAPLPITPGNVFAGAGWTLLIFVPAVTWITAAVTTVLAAGSGFGAVFIGAFAGGYALVIAGGIGLVAAVVLGIPLSLAVEAILRGTSSVRAHAVGAAVAGALSALLLIAVVTIVSYSTSPYTSVEYGAVEYESATTSTVDPWSVLFYGAVVLVTAASSAGGWLLALRQHRSAENAARLSATLGEAF